MKEELLAYSPSSSSLVEYDRRDGGLGAPSLTNVLRGGDGVGDVERGGGGGERLSLLSGMFEGMLEDLGGGGAFRVSAEARNALFGGEYEPLRIGDIPLPGELGGEVCLAVGGGGTVLVIRVDGMSSDSSYGSSDVGSF
jgi:hypothetical protein